MPKPAPSSRAGSPVGGETRCSIRSPGAGLYACTLPANHEGQHECHYGGSTGWATSWDAAPSPAPAPSEPPLSDEWITKIYDLLVDDSIWNVSMDEPPYYPGEIIRGRVYRDIVRDRIRHRLASPAPSEPEPSEQLGTRSPITEAAVTRLREIALAGSKSDRSDYGSFLSTLDAGALLCEVELVEAARTVLRSAALPRAGSVASEVETRLAGIEARVGAAQLGPWTWHHRRDDADAPASIISGAETGRASAVAMCPRFGLPQFRADAEFIAHARDDVPWLISQLRAALSPASTDAEPAKCPSCGEMKLHPLRFDDRTRIRTWTCLWPKCANYRRLVDEDDGDCRDRNTAARSSSREADQGGGNG